MVRSRNLQGWLAEFSEKVGEWHHRDHGEIGTDWDTDGETMEREAQIGPHYIKTLKQSHFRTPEGPIYPQKGTHTTL